MLGLPLRPAFVFIFKEHHNIVFPRELLSDKRRLFFYMLDIKCQAIPLDLLFTHCMFGCIAIGKRIKDDHWFFVLVYSRSIDCYLNILSDDKLLYPFSLLC